MTNSTLQDIRVPTRYKLSATWASLMFCFMYADYFELYVPGKLQGMLKGNMEPLGAVTQSMLAGTSVMLALPSLMILLSMILPASACRWLNVLVALLYAVIQFLVISRSGWTFYIGFGVLEIMLFGFAAWTAWKWPTMVPQAAGVAAVQSAA